MHYSGASLSLSGHSWYFSTSFSEVPRGYLRAVSFSTVISCWQQLVSSHVFVLWWVLALGWWKYSIPPSFLLYVHFVFILCFASSFPACCVVLCFVYIRNLHASRFCRLAPSGYILLWTGVSCAVVQFSGLIISCRVNKCHVAICSAYVVGFARFFPVHGDMYFFGLINLVCIILGGAYSCWGNCLSYLMLWII